MVDTVDKVCYYHHPCMDGMTSAWIVRNNIPGVLFIGMDHRDNTMPLIYQDADVYMVDFCSNNEDWMIDCVTRARSFVHLDHHDTVQTTMQRLATMFDKNKYQATFDLEQSGAGLTWNHFHPSVEKPYLVSRVEDRDIWRLRYKDTKAFCQGLQEIRKTFSNWDQYQDPKMQERLRARGRVLLNELQQRCRQQIAKTAISLYLDAGNWGILEIPFTRLVKPSDATEQANMMLNTGLTPIAGCWFKARTKITFSIYSNSEDLHSGFICKEFGGRDGAGGGHKNAGGGELAIEGLVDNPWGFAPLASLL